MLHRSSHTLLCGLIDRERKYNMHERKNALEEWLVCVIQHKNFTLTPLAGDASFRRYFRIEYNGRSEVVMDAPPGKEDLAPFIYIAQKLASAGVLTPKILAINKEQGFLLISDLGERLLLDELSPQTANTFYMQAMRTLFKLQQCSIEDPLISSFDNLFMLKEMNLCPEWFFNAYLSLTLDEAETKLIQNTFNWIATEVSKQPIVFIHRDYHSRNLMLVDTPCGRELGVIDFQDAMRGPAAYDLVSLLKDCYIAWPRENVLEWITFFYQNSPIASHYTLKEWTRSFDLSGLQRHLKVLGVFCRLALRDGKPGYLKDLPLTLHYVLECAGLYEELRPFYDFLEKKVLLP